MRLSSSHLPVLWTVSVSRLSGLLADVALEYADRARFHAIDLAFDEAQRVIAQRLQREHCDVVVAGGANAAFLRGRLEVPLVTVQASGFDLLAALTRARRIHPRVGLVTHTGDLPDVGNFAHAFELGLTHRTFDTREEARDCVAGLRAEGIGVIVGTGLAIDFAEAAGLPGVLLYSADAVRRSFDQALALIHADGDGDGQRHAPTGRSPRRPNRYSLLGDSPALVSVRSTIALYAPQSGSVLIEGETGTGKDIVARQLHATSARHGRLYSLGCAGRDAASLEAELGIGEGRRSPLQETAAGGSLLLDQVDELPLGHQGLLLRVLDACQQHRNGSVGSDIRILATCSQPLADCVASGRFRADLYHRLSALPLYLPPLRERSSDAALLLDHYLAIGGPVVPLAASARMQLLQHHWPGNVRELRNVAERIALQWRHRPLGPVEVSHLRQWVPEIFTNGQPLAQTTTTVTSVPLSRPDPATLRAELLRAGGDRQRLQQRYGISRTTLWRWLRQAGLE